MSPRAHAVDPARLAQWCMEQRLSAGAHVVVVSVEHQDFDDAVAIAYDLRNGKRYPLPGQAWTAGDWLLWRDGEDYLLAPIRR